MVRDRFGVAAPRVTSAPQSRFFRHRRRATEQCSDTQCAAQHGQSLAHAHLEVGTHVAERQRRVHVVVDVDVARDVGASEAELARRTDEAAQRHRRADRDACIGVVRAERGAVPEREADGRVGAEHAAQQWSQRVRGGHGSEDGTSRAPIAMCTMLVPMTTLLVANRGEIVLRVFRTAKRMGMRTVAVYSDADVQAPHVRAADVAVRIGPAPASESYLRRDRVLDAARETGADLIHPGYGFLAEDDRFASDCQQAGLTFVGPPAEVLRVVGDKATARGVAEAAGVPVLAGYAGDAQSDEVLRREAERIGFPVLVKPAAGGGGKGMLVVRETDELAPALASARRVAAAAFDDDRLILERYIEGPRHVEVQILADAHGNVIHLGERDCSVQRRHQKVIEEAPAPALDDATRARLHEAGLAFAKHASYVGAGTCEFLVSVSGDIGFIEMNARLQVEHPVTEVVFDVDLVELQLRVALGERLPIEQSDVIPRGHAIEARIYAEDASAGFVPPAGRIEHIGWPPNARVDTGIEEGTDVPTHYDPLLAKVVVGAGDRAASLNALDEALASTQVLGVATNVAFLRTVVADADLRRGGVSTDWLERSYGDWRRPMARADGLAFAVAAAAEAHRLSLVRSTDPWVRLRGWRAGARDATTSVPLHADGRETVVTVHGTGPYRVGELVLSRSGDCHGWLAGDRLLAAARAAHRWLVWDDDQYEVDIGTIPRRADVAAARLDSPLPGQVIAVRVAAGEHVARGTELIVVEAMKMEHSISAPADGTVRSVLCAAGDQVDRGQALVDFEPDAAATTTPGSSP